MKKTRTGLLAFFARSRGASTESSEVHEHSEVEPEPIAGISVPERELVENRPTAFGQDDQKKRRYDRAYLKLGLLSPLEATVRRGPCV